MPLAIPVAIRQIIIERHLQGDSLPNIARDLDLSHFSVRNIWRRYRDDPQGNLAPHYYIIDKPLSHPLVVRGALMLKRRHPSWGAELIRQVINQKWPHLPLPSTSAFQRWFRQANLQPPRSKLPAANHNRALAPHQVWQMDAVSGVQLANGQRVCWLSLSDEASGALLRAEAFEFAVWEQATAQQVADYLRRAFVQWGIPERIRVDNGAPWGGWSDLPRELALWLLGLGIEVIWNKPHRPQQNGVVERSHGVCKAWVEPHTCADAAELQRRLDWASEMQRERYPSIKGQSRMAAFPQLAAGGREYHEEEEEEQWQQSSVHGWLSKGLWQRRVSKKGQITLYNRHLGVGRRYGGEIMVVRFDPVGIAWVIMTQGGEEIKRYAAPELSGERIKGFDVLERRRAKEPSV
jgi:transposase InsO family protein